MNRNLLRWILTALIALALIFMLSCPYIAGAEGVLPSDYKEGGKPAKADGWVFENKLPVSYEDSTIRVTFEKLEVKHTLTGPNQGKKVKDEAWIVRIKIKDPSQLRAAVSKDTYEGKHQSDAAAIATSKNAVVAMNGDFFKYENDVGYVVRHGELIRDATSNPRRVFDMLLIDSEGDFHAVYSASTESIEAYVAENLTPIGRTIMHTYNIGPVLVVNGEAQDVSQSEMARQGQYQWTSGADRPAGIRHRRRRDQEQNLRFLHAGIRRLHRGTVSGCHPCLQSGWRRFRQPDGAVQGQNKERRNRSSGERADQPEQ